MSDLAVFPSIEPGPVAASRARQTLVLAGLAHALHDGFTSSIYVLLPVWQSQFALGYGAMAILRALYVGSLALLQVPSSRLARFIAPRTILALGTLLSAAGYALAGFSGGLAGCALLLRWRVRAAAPSIHSHPPPCLEPTAKRRVAPWAPTISQATWASRRFRRPWPSF